ncbi:hypothetical protein [Aeromicrobium sp. Leaf350]|uniref:hypothetical protein n=1 Tax=Aeromicrobium sp. Leaf350 TaxID=2876565 RepID=UPI001E497E18|nr:hypothetical protein [Aeromicrobium sp. Leaf350]
MSTTPRRLTPTVVAAAVLVALVAVLLVWQQPWSSDDAAAGGDESDLDTSLRSQLVSLADAVDPSTWAEGFGPGGSDLAATTWQARQSLGVDGVDVALVSLADAADRSDGSRSAVVRVRWTVAPGAVLGASDEVTATLGLRVRPSAGAETVDLLGFEPRADGAGTDPLPLWLSGSLTLQTAGSVTLVTVDGVDGAGIPEAPALVEVAQAQVARLTGQAGPAVVVVPPTADLAAAVLGRTVDALGPVAGVAIDLPGGDVPVVVLNPGEFDRMDARGRQLVVTHELTHAMTGAVGSTAEPWIVEGFADWVALREDTTPLSIAAGALLQQVAGAGAPGALPAAADLAGPTSGAAYQGAWLAVDVLGREHGGDATVLQVYDAVIAGTPLEQALAAADTSLAELTTEWQDYLTYSASTVS